MTLSRAYTPHADRTARENPLRTPGFWNGVGSYSRPAGAREKESWGGGLNRSLRGQARHLPRLGRADAGGGWVGGARGGDAGGALDGDAGQPSAPDRGR